METPDDPTPPIARWLTIPGRVLLIVVFVGSIGGVWWYVESTIQSAPSGTYPLLLWAVPVLLAALILFAVVAALLEKLGIQIYKKPRK